MEDNIIINEENDNESKAVTFEVNMTAGIMYDYLINHAYTGSSGIIGTCFGAVGILLFVKTMFPLYLIIGLMLILYLPFTLGKQASNAVKNNPVYKEPLTYTLDCDGITVSQNDIKETASWDKCTKAVSSKQSIIIYTGKRNAFVFPRKQLKDKLTPAIAVVAENMDPKKVKIRF